jgi:hypothetical protein
MVKDETISSPSKSIFVKNSCHGKIEFIGQHCAEVKVEDVCSVDDED